MDARNRSWKLVVYCLFCEIFFFQHPASRFQLLYKLP